MFFEWLSKAKRGKPAKAQRADAICGVSIRVVGVGGGGGNAVRRMAERGMTGARYLALNTDVQALRELRGIQTFAIGPSATGGAGSGGKPEIGRKAMRESQPQVASLIQGADMVFIAAGLGGGTGSGGAALVADIARKQGALTVGVATLPFGFEGPRRRENAETGLRQLRQKVDTLIIVENDRLLPALDGRVRLDNAFRLADEILRQGVRGILDIVTVSGMINVDFADVKSVMSGGGDAFMAVGSGEGRDAAANAVRAALANPLFDAPIRGAKGVLLNVTGGSDLTLGQVHQAADIIESAVSSDANIVFGVAQDEAMESKVSITLIGTGIERDAEDSISKIAEIRAPSGGVAKANGHSRASVASTRTLSGG